MTKLSGYERLVVLKGGNMFYTFRQNNSGGRFSYDEKAGISVNVIIEADSVGQAAARAESAGLYFDGVEEDLDCSCCGDRWSVPYEDGSDLPQVYGKTIVLGQSYVEANAGESFSFKWMKNKPEGFVHYADGRVEPFWN